jgi:hypothetical protein
VDNQIPDVYCDTAQINLSPVDMILLLSRRSPRIGTTEPATPVGYIRTSLEHAKILAIILRRTLKKYEDDLGSPIQLPLTIYQQLGISPQEDW